MASNRGHPPKPKEKKGMICGAKKKNGEVCKSTNIFENNRCRYHGGMSTGAPKGSQNAIKHGANSNINYIAKFFSQEQQDYMNNMDMDTLAILNEEIRTITMRELYMIENIAKLKAQEYMTTTIEETNIQSGNRTTNEIKKTQENNHNVIIRAEEALTKVQLQKLKMINQKAQLEAQRKASDEVDITKVVDAISATDVWNDEDEKE